MEEEWRVKGEGESIIVVGLIDSFVEYKRNVFTPRRVGVVNSGCRQMKLGDTVLFLLFCLLA